MFRLIYGQVAYMHAHTYIHMSTCLTKYTTKNVRSVTMLKFEINLMRIGQVIRIWNDIDFSWNTLYISNDIKSFGIPCTLTVQLELLFILIVLNIFQITNSQPILQRELYLVFRICTSKQFLKNTKFFYLHCTHTKKYSYKNTFCELLPSAKIIHKKIIFVQPPVIFFCLLVLFYDSFQH